MAELFGNTHGGETLLAVNSPFPKKANVAGLPLLSLRWLGPTATATTLATIAWYSSDLPPDDPRLEDLDPAANREWYLEESVVFASNPGETKEVESLTIADNPYSTLLAVVTVLADMSDFSLRVKGQ